MSTVIALATTTGRVLVVPPSAAPAGAEWAVIRLDHTPEHHLTIEFERSADGQAWESAGSVTFGDDHTRDYTFPMHYRVRASISADGYTYRVYVDSGAAEVTYQGYFDFEGSRAVVALGAGVEIAGYERLEIGAPAHYNLIQNCTLPPLAGLTGENCAVAVIIARHNNTPVGGELGWTVGNPDYGDHEVVRWGGSGGVTLERLLFSENQISASVCGYCATGVSPDDNPRVYAQWTTPPEWYLSRPNPFNNLTPHVTIAAIALKNVRQSDPIRGLWRACTQPVGSMLGCGASTALNTVDGNVPTSPGDVVIGAASLIVVENDPSADITAGGVVLSHHLWSHATTGPGADSWVGVIDAKEADVGAQTSMSYTASFDIAHQTNFTGAAFAFAQTEYVHHVAILTPEDLGDLPDADQVRAGTDGFGAPALDYQKRGPDASGRVIFDPFVGDIPEQTDISLGFVYEGEDDVAWAHITTAQAVHYVAVETPEDPEGLPTAAQIKAGTDGNGSPALDYQARTLAAGTITFSPTTGAESGKSYTLAFVTGDEPPVFADVPRSIMAAGAGIVLSVAAGMVSQLQPVSGAGYQWSVGSGAVGTQHVVMAAGAGRTWSLAEGAVAQMQPVSGGGYTWSISAGSVAQQQPVSGEGYTWSVGEGAIEHNTAAVGSGYTWSLAEGAVAQMQPVFGGGHTWSISAGSVAQQQPVSGEGYQWSVGEGAASVEIVTPVSGAGYQWSIGDGVVAQIQPVAGAGVLWSVGGGTTYIEDTVPVSGVGYQWSVGDGEIAQLQPASGAGYQWSVGDGEIAQLQPATGDGVTWSAAQGTVAQIQPGTGEGFLWSVATGAVGTDHTITATGAGYTWSIAEGAVTTELVVAGRGYTLSVAEGMVSQLQPVAGEGSTWSIGTGAVAQLSSTSGEGYTWSVGRGTAAQLIKASGAGYQWSLAEGAVDTEHLVPVAGTGFQWSLAEGAVSLILPVTGGGHTWSVHEGAVSLILPISGEGHTWSVARGTFSQLVPVKGEGFTWNIAAGAVGTEHLVPVAGRGYQWSVTGGGAVTQLQPANGSGYQWSVTGGGAVTQIQPVTGSGYTWSVASGTVAQIHPISAEGYTWSVHFGDAWGMLFPQPLIKPSIEIEFDEYSVELIVDLVDTEEETE